MIGHLVDSACNNHQRFVRAQNCTELIFPKYEQNEWVAAGHYRTCPWGSLVQLWHAYNQQLAHVIRHIPESDLSTQCTITPNAVCTLGFLVTDYVAHLHHHLNILNERIDKETRRGFAKNLDHAAIRDAGRIVLATVNAGSWVPADDDKIPPVIAATNPTSVWCLKGTLRIEYGSGKYGVDGGQFGLLVYKEGEPLGSGRRLIDGVTYYGDLPV